MDDAYGWRIGKVADPFGHVWEIGRRLDGSRIYDGCDPHHASSSSALHALTTCSAVTPHSAARSVPYGCHSSWSRRARRC